MVEEIKSLINELSEINSKFNKQLSDNPNMLWTYKSAKMNEISVNTKIIKRLEKIIE